MYDSIATLKAYSTSSYDEYGNKVTTVEETDVYVQPRGVYNSEFYNAAALGLKPSITFYITNRADYDGQKVIEFEDVEYNVIRVDWTAQRDGISLICEERMALKKNYAKLVLPESNFLVMPDGKKLALPYNRSV